MILRTDRLSWKEWWSTGLKSDEVYGPACDASLVVAGISGFGSRSACKGSDGKPLGGTLSSSTGEGDLDDLMFKIESICERKYFCN